MHLPRLPRSFASRRPDRTARRGVRLLGAFLLCGTMVVISAASATASASIGTASYDGQTINLAQGWDGAQACVVFTATNIQCFDTAAEMKVAEVAHGAVTPIGTIGAQPATSCGGSSDYLALFQNSNFGGQELDIDNIDYWVNLSNYGFGNEMSSWINYTSCNADGSRGTNGGVTPYLTMGANNYSTYVGASWNDAMNSEVILD